MKGTPLLLVASLGLGVLLTYWPSAQAGGTSATATTIACTTTNQTCGATTCDGLVPDAGSATGIPTANVQSYFVRVCPPTGQVLDGAGTAQDFHCRAANGKCAEVRDNRQTINAPNGPRGTCWESATFVVPYIDNTSDTMTWIVSGVTVSPVDAGTATIAICPQQ